MILSVLFLLWFYENCRLRTHLKYESSVSDQACRHPRAQSQALHNQSQAAVLVWTTTDPGPPDGLVQNQLHFQIEANTTVNQQCVYYYVLILLLHWSTKEVKQI